MIERFTRWWLTKPNNWVAVLLFAVLLLCIGVGAYWAYQRTGSIGLSIGIGIVCLVLMFIVFVVVPLALGVHYGITPATRRRRDTD